VIRNDRWAVRADDFDKQPGRPPSITLLRFGPVRDTRYPRLQFRLLFNGQYTDNTLISGEQFGFGGKCRWVAAIRNVKSRRTRGNSVNPLKSTPPTWPALFSLSGTQLRLLGFY